MNPDRYELQGNLREHLPDLTGVHRELAEAYLALEERFEKVIKISDKYHLEAIENWRERHKLERQLRAMQSEPAPSRYPETGTEHRDEQSRTAPGAGVGAFNPLLRVLSSNDYSDENVKQLLQLFRKLNARLDKIVTISDRYQAQLHEITTRMEHMARTDLLTELSNRRDMVERLNAEVARAIRNQSPFSLLLFDIDHFKQINDTYGHDVGDTVLHTVAQELRTVVRRSDSCSRWGGEEFLILCPDTGPDQGFMVAEKCRASVEALSIPAAPPMNDRPVSLTLSGGVSAWIPEQEREPSWYRLVQLADQALYNAKNSGRNRVLHAQQRD